MVGLPEIGLSAMRAKDLYGMQRPRVVHSTRPVIKLVATLGEIVFPIDCTVSLKTPDTLVALHITMRGDGWERSYIAVGTQSFLLTSREGGYPHPPLTPG